LVAGVGEVFGEQIHVHTDDRQRVFDLVRERPGELRDFSVLLAKLLDEKVAVGRRGGHETSISVAKFGRQKEPAAAGRRFGRLMFYLAARVPAATRLNEDVA
jgi:hypothetical protein